MAKKRMPRKRYEALIQQYNKGRRAFVEALDILKEQLSEQGDANLENDNSFQVTYESWPDDLDAAIEIYEYDPEEWWNK